MGEPGQGYPHPKIIDRPELKSGFRHFLEGSITVMLWALWLYWILPVLTLLLWFFGLRFFFLKVFSKNILSELFEIIKNGGAVILIILTVTIIWIYYNYNFIFKRKGERRKRISVCPDETIAKFFDVEPQLLEKAKKNKRVTVELKDNKFIINASAGPGLK